MTMCKRKSLRENGMSKVASFSVCKKLFHYVQTPDELLAMKRSHLQELAHPLGFYRKKSATCLSVSRELCDRFHGTVPCSEAALLSIKGVGRKTANLVLSLSCRVPAICVDTHVHRLANAFHVVRTKNPEQTEHVLQGLFKKEQWQDINRYFVKFGQQIPRRKQQELITQIINQWKIKRT